MELFNYKDNCRLCLKRHTDFMKNIFTCCVEGYQDTLVQNVFALFKVELNPHEDYPQFICRKCLTELENILLFQEDLQNNQEFLLGLFRATYPNYIEKDFHTVHCSEDCSTKFKSIAVNTDPWVNLEDLGNSEYVKVPVDFLKQFSPEVSLHRFNKASCVNNKSTNVKEEVAQVDSLKSDTELSVNSCKYCRKVFGSQALVNTHYKEAHKLETRQKQNETRKKASKSTQKSSSGKINNEKKKKVLLTNVLELSTEQINLPQMDLQNNNTAHIKEELRDSPSSQQGNEVLTEPVFQEKQAFLQNFDLIAKQEAALLKIKQEALQRLPKSSSFKKQMKKLKNLQKRKGSRLLKSKNKLIVKPFQKRVQNKRTEKEILCRSVEFLKRYGWRTLKSSSRRGTSYDRNSLFEKSVTTKSVSRKMSPKNSLEAAVLKEKPQLVQMGASKIAIQKGCEPKGTQKTHLPIKIKRRNSVESFKNQMSEEKTICNSQNGTSNLKKSTASSKTSNKNSVKLLNITVDDIKNTKLDLVIKSEPLTEFQVIKDDDKSKGLAASSSKSFNENIPTKPVTGKKIVGNKRITNNRVVETSLKHLGKDIKQEFISNKTKLSNGSIMPIKSEELHNIKNQEPQVDIKEVDIKLKLFGSNSIESFRPIDDLQVKKELMIQLERERSPVKLNGFNGSLVDVEFAKNNFEISEQKPDISHLGDAFAEFSRRKGRSRNTVTSISTNHINFTSPGCSTSNNLVFPKKRGRPLKDLAKETLNLISTNDSKILKVNNWLNKTPQPHKTLTVATRKSGRPRKEPISEVFLPSSQTPSNALDFTQKSPVLNIKASLLNKSRSESPPTREIKIEQLSTLQDLTERFEKEDNIGLRMKLRKTASCESLNSLKYDTQELDENFQIKVEAIDQSTTKNLKGVPDNKSWFSHDKLVNNDLVGVLIKNEGLYREKVVNIDLEDEEVQMVVLISDDEDNVDFDNDTSSVIDKYIKSKRRGLGSEQRKCKKDLRLEVDSLYKPVNDELVVEKEQKHRSQTSLQPLPLSKLNLRKTNSSNSLVSDRPRRCIETTPVKRKGRPPNKFSPAVYSTKHSKSTAELTKRNLNNSHVGLIQEKFKSRSRSANQLKTNSCVKELFNDVRKKGRPKKEKYQIMSVI